jgi:hypothetical protein
MKFQLRLHTLPDQQSTGTNDKLFSRSAYCTTQALLKILVRTSPLWGPKQIASNEARAFISIYVPAADALPRRWKWLARLCSLHYSQHWTMLIL